VFQKKRNACSLKSCLIILFRTLTLTGNLQFRLYNTTPQSKNSLVSWKVERAQKADPVPAWLYRRKRLHTVRSPLDSTWKSNAVSWKTVLSCRLGWLHPATYIDLLTEFPAIIRAETRCRPLIWWWHPIQRVFLLLVCCLSATHGKRQNAVTRGTTACVRTNPRYSAACSASISIPTTERDNTPWQVGTTGRRPSVSASHAD
jgi:hypothetical protein